MRPLEELIKAAVVKDRLRVNIIKTSQGWQASVAREEGNAWSVGIADDPVAALRRALDQRPEPPEDGGIFG